MNPFPDEEVEEEGRSRQQLEAELEAESAYLQSREVHAIFWNLAGSTILADSTGDAPTTHC